MSPLDSLSAIIRHRRTIKPASMDPDRPLDRSLLLTLLENATWAPTHGLTEPWRFRIFEGAARQDIASALQRIYREVTPAHEFREDKLMKMSENALLAPTVVVTWMQRTIGHKVPAIEEREAVACALQNIMLSAAAIDLGAFWSSPPLIDSTEFRTWLGIGDEDVCLALLYLGWPKPGFAWPASVRKPISDLITWA